MGRRLNVSTPTVINTELVPLDESFYLDVDGQTEQWYYENTEQYAPNRKVTPLLLVPVISAFDKDTSTTYTPSFYTTQWFANEWNEAQGKYVETEITNQVDSGSADYVIQGNNLLVKKNVSYSHAVSIRCVATYIDPRDNGVMYAVEDSINLTTNRTADVVFPEVDIISPSGRAYNPLVDDENSQYDFKGVTTNNPVQPLNTDVRRYSVDVDGTEEILNSGEAVAPIMDIRYGNNPTMEDQEFMYRQTAGGTLVGESLDKAYIERIKGNTVAWNQLVSSTEPLSLNRASARTGYVGSFSPVYGHKYYASFVLSNCVNNANYTLGLKILNGSQINDFVISNGRKSCIQYVYDSNSRGDYFFISSVASNETACTISNVITIDLTLMFGAGNEPTTVEEFEADYERWFGKPLSYEEYDAGSLRPVLMQSVKTTGFNQWDGVYEAGKLFREGGVIDTSYNIYAITGFIPALPNKEYFITVNDGSATYLCFYDANKNYIGGHIHNDGSSLTVTTPPRTAYIRDCLIIEHSSSYCINISDPSKNGTYEPYEEKVQGFDVTAIKGRLNGAGNSVTIFPDGLKKAGTVQDEIFVENGVVKAIKRVGSVDLGTADWSISSIGNDKFYFALIRGTFSTKNLLCSHYPINKTNDEFVDKYISSFNDGVSTFFIRFQNTSFAGYSISQLKTAMNGVMLYYELATPETYVLDPITDFVWYGIKEGQEVLADTLPWYVSGQGTDNLVVDAMYGENINVVLRCKMMDGETLSPSKAYATLSWRIPDIEAFVQSDNGGAVRSDTKDMTFDTIVNVNGAILSDALKQKHLAFNWKIRKNNVSTETDKGWGQRITIDASDLRNVRGSGSILASTIVGNEVYLLGAYEEVTDDNEVVTDDGQTVFDRPVN